MLNTTTTIRCDHRLVCASAPSTPAQVFDRAGRYPFRYMKGHEALPHVVKFSGGRSSGMLLFTLLEAGLLDASRGDVVVFNNTSAEHPATYAFSAQCKRIVEEEYGIPFFWIEAQTYEDARDGDWVRMPSYRLVNSAKRTAENPDGYAWHGEVFEELLSWQGFVPNQFRRICTTGMKLEPTRAFLKDWFAGKEETTRLGHHGNAPRLDLEQLYQRHRKNRGGVPEEIFAKKKAFLESRPFYRPAQRFVAFSSSFVPFSNSTIEPHLYGGKARFGAHGEGVEYLAFIGLRYDEMRRVIRTRERNSEQTPEAGYDGEHVYMPLADICVTARDVITFWKAQSWDLNIEGSSLSNCTFCFLKGAKVLGSVRDALADSGTGEYARTPCNIDWWVNLEKRYGRDLVAEKRGIRNKHNDKMIGFFGIGSGFSYATLAASQKTGSDLSEFSDSVLPCDCTD